MRENFLLPQEFPVIVISLGVTRNLNVITFLLELRLLLETCQFPFQEEGLWPFTLFLLFHLHLSVQLSLAWCLVRSLNPDTRCPACPPPSPPSLGLCPGQGEVPEYPSGGEGYSRER